jgi:hypothetical protein
MSNRLPPQAGRTQMMKGFLMFSRARRGPRALFLLLILLASLLSACDLLGGPQATPTPTPPSATPVSPADTPVAGIVTATPGATISPPATTGAAITPPPTRPVAGSTPNGSAAPASTAVTDTPGGPLFEVAVNGMNEAEVPQGWPLLVLVNLTHPDIASPDAVVTPLAIGAAGRKPGLCNWPSRPLRPSPLMPSSKGNCSGI